MATTIYTYLHKDDLKGSRIVSIDDCMCMMYDINRDDAAAAQWWPINALPKLAFDHDKILADAVQALKING